MHLEKNSYIRETYSILIFPSVKYDSRLSSYFNKGTINHIVFLKLTSAQSIRGCDGENVESKKGLSVGKSSMEKTVKQAAVNTTKESSVIAQIRELLWIGQPTKALELAS